MKKTARGVSASLVTGSVVYHSEQGAGRFQFEKGPIFGNVVPR